MDEQQFLNEDADVAPSSDTAAGVRDCTKPESIPEPQLEQLGELSEEDNLESPGVAEAHAKYQCSLCSRKFTRRHNLQGHLRTHSQHRPFPCSHCSKTFTRANDRKVHEREAHTKGAAHRYICNDFIIKDESGNKSRECRGCGKSFTRLTTLKRHQESIAHGDVVGLQEIEQQLEEGVPLQAFSTWMKTGRTTDLAELEQTITERRTGQKQETKGDNG